MHNNSTTPVDREGAFNGLFTQVSKGPSPDPGYYASYQEPDQWVGIARSTPDNSNPFLDGPPAFHHGLGTSPADNIDPFSDGAGQEGFVSPGPVRPHYI